MLKLCEKLDNGSARPKKIVKESLQVRKNVAIAILWLVYRTIGNRFVVTTAYT